MCLAVGTVCRTDSNFCKNRSQGYRLQHCHRHPHQRHSAVDMGDSVCFRTFSGGEDCATVYMDFLVLSGLATGLSWLFYFKAIQLGDVSRVAPIDKLSVVFTILLSFFILKESLTPRVIAGGLLITAGALVMIWKDDIEIEADEIGIVYPIYGHMPPNMVRQFIKKAKLKADYKFAILTYGNRKCNAVEIWDKISRDAGVPFDYINTLIMVDNWLPNFDMNEQVLIDKHIPENLEKIRADIYDRKSWHEPVSEEERMQHQGFIIILLHRKVSRLRGTANFVLPAYRIVPRKLSSL